LARHGHLPDITLAKPIFRDGKLVAFSATTAHAPDIAARSGVPSARGLRGGAADSADEDDRRRKTDETLVAIIRKNVRTPDQTMAICGPGRGARSDGRPPAQPDGSYGLADLTDLARDPGPLRDGDAAAIRDLPDGTYHSALKTDGLMETRSRSGWSSPSRATRS